MKDTFLLLASSAFRCVFRPMHLLVVTIHRVDDRWGLPLKTVTRQLSYLKNKYSLILPSQIRKKNYNKRRVALVTLDDGYQTSMRLLEPVLEKLDIPLTVCLSTNFFLRNEWLWFDKLRYAFDQKKDAVSLTVNGSLFRTDDKKSLDTLFTTIKKERPEKAQCLISEILEKLRADLPEHPVEPFSPITFEAICRHVEKGSVEIASHGIGHHRMTNLSDRELSKELKHSKTELENVFGKKINTFCYPFGLANDFDGRTEKAVADAGYNVCFTSIEGLNNPEKTNFLRLKRIHVHSSRGVFCKLTSGLGEFQNLYRGNRNI